MGRIAPDPTFDRMENFILPGTQIEGLYEYDNARIPILGIDEESN